MSEFMALMMGYAFLAEPPGPVPVDPAHPFQTQGPHDIVTVASGRKIQVGRYGRQGGRPLLFFHGLYQGPYLSEELDRAFEAAGFDVFAPSRPGFNRSDPPRHWPDFNTTTTDDVLSVCNHYGLKSVAFIVHQAGISFACRAGKALGPRALAAVMICAGVPIKDYMLKTMNIEARVAGAAVKYAPKVFDLLLRLGIAKWRRQGPHAYLANLFQESAPDRETLSHPARGPIMSKGALHMISQGPPTIIHDARSAMGDWEAEYLGLPHRQLWLHGAQDNVMNPQFVAEFLAAHDQPPPIVYPDRGGDILLAEPLDVVEKIRDFLRT